MNLMFRFNAKIEYDIKTHCAHGQLRPSNFILPTQIELFRYESLDEVKSR